MGVRGAVAPKFRENLFLGQITCKILAAINAVVQELLKSINSVAEFPKISRICPNFPNFSRIFLTKFYRAKFFSCKKCLAPEAELLHL